MVQTKKSVNGVLGKVQFLKWAAGESGTSTGLTLEYIQTLLRSKKPKTLHSVCLLSKPSRRQKKVVIDHVGFEIEDHFVVGYGLDYEQQYRHLPHISIVEVTSEQ